MYDLILYDTSNFRDFPMGGQLTSIRNFLKYVAACRPEAAKRILLVGITDDPAAVGKVGCVEVDQTSFAVLPVLCRERDLANVKKSLRLEYVKGLFRHRKQIPSGKGIVHYIHTPEAYLVVKLLHPAARTAIFSHGSFFNMVQNFRFFQNNRLIRVLFEQFLVLLLKTADLIFVLDSDSENQYRKYTKKVVRVENSIVLPENRMLRKECGIPVRLLFVGRLSRVKGIDGLLEAMTRLWGKAHLTIVGDGEERAALEKLVEEKQLQDAVCLAGSCTPEEVQTYYRSSDILVMNSSMEGKPMVILEAMSYGLPVLTTPVGGIPELVRQGQEGEYTDGTPEQIAVKLEMIRDKYHFYGENALKQACMYDYRRINGTVFEKISEIQ